eukprot:CAMPEP_0172810968 /NCGR_PEP_ID=MMETSP1075-20121228/9129_1 /TAXON_ID=2916 /ORGANISM="Ceratium fusus, Strain PA161109" /LENGTH=990 /DNA_ID=CAMNT_0013650353 /DNA_START=71 /DNA_END=3041 /DNA_ORIENTATION=+
MHGRAQLPMASEKDASHEDAEFGCDGHEAAPSEGSFQSCDEDMQVVVVGAGTSGLAAAKAVFNAGCSVVVLEKRMNCSRWEGSEEDRENCRCRFLTRARVTRLLMTSSGSCRGCVYWKAGEEHMEYGPVVLCTGGFLGDFSDDSVLARHRPDLLHLPTTCHNKHANGDGLRLAEAANARTMGLDWIQVEPTAMVKPDEPQAKFKLLADASLRSAGALILNQEGDRICNELAGADHIACEMWRGRGPFRLVLNSAASKEVAILCRHYIECGAMRVFESGEALARDMGVPLSVLQAVCEAHHQAAGDAEADPDDGPHPGFPSGRSYDEPSGRLGCGKMRFPNAIPGAAVKTEQFHVAMVTPAIHHCRGGLEATAGGAVLLRGDFDGDVSEDATIHGLYAAGELVVQRVGSDSSMNGKADCECTVAGGAAGRAAAHSLLSGKMKGSYAKSQIQQKVSGCDPQYTAPSESPPVANSTDARNGDAPLADQAQGESSPDLRKRAAAMRLERFLETRLTASALQAAMAGTHLDGNLELAVQGLRDRLCGNSQEIDHGGPMLQVAMRDTTFGRSNSGKLPTTVARTALPDAGAPCRELPVACVYCRLPLVLEVGRGGTLTGTDTECCVEGPVGAEEGAPCAYATLLYGNKVEYFLGALVTGWSIKATGSTLERLLLHTDDVPGPFLKALSTFWTPREVQYLEGCPKLYKEYNKSRFKSVFTKLQALTCTDFSKVLMLDLDMLVRSNLDELFSLRAPAALRRSSGREQPPHGGTFSAEDMWHANRTDMSSGINAGVMLLEPDHRIFDRMAAEIQDPRHPEHIGTYGPEQDYLARFYSTFLSGRWTHIHARFNYQPMLPRDYVSSAHRKLDLQRDVIVAHYSGPRVKPWKLNGRGDLDVGSVMQLLHDGSVCGLRSGEPLGASSCNERSQGGRQVASQSKERIMDGVVVKDTGPEELPANVRALMWEWVEALRSCVEDLKQMGINIVDIISEVHTDHNKE